MIRQGRASRPTVAKRHTRRSSMATDETASMLGLLFTNITSISSKNSSSTSSLHKNNQHCITIRPHHRRCFPGAMLRLRNALHHLRCDIGVVWIPNRGTTSTVRAGRLNTGHICPVRTLYCSLPASPFIQLVVWRPNRGTTSDVKVGGLNTGHIWPN